MYKIDNMVKKNTLEEGQIYVIKLSNGLFTLTQLINHHVVTERKSEDTFAFFNYLFTTLENIQDEAFKLDYSNPIAITTINGYPKTYGWMFLGKQEISISFDYKKNISSLGFYNNQSTDPSLFLEPYFGLFPWDGYYKENYVEEELLPNAEIRKDIKFLKDFTIEELKKLLPANSPKLIQRLKEENR
ncbi:hypothetical protein [Capnocytophaga canis]|uniref:hypothetical protein n=1 Tax=Capnocytophaga canis TaxID=1848903 RepID=UPI001562DF35|nr:hypothetical protein [Capnocytophaga canis]